MANSEKNSDKTADYSWRALLRGERGLYCLTLTAGIILYAIIDPISYTVLPALIKDLHAEIYYSWVMTAFALGSLIGVCLLSCSLRLMPAHIAYIAALLLFTACSLGCAYAPSLPLLLLNRFIQGIGGGLLVALTYNMLNTALPAPLLPRGIGLIAFMWGVASFAGPYLGGAFADWRTPFFILSAAAILFCLIVFINFRRLGRHSGRARQLPQPVSPLAIMLLCLCVLAVSIGGSIEGLEPGLKAAFNAAGFSLHFEFGALAGSTGGLAIGFCFLLLLAASEKRSQNRLLPSGSFTPGSIFFKIFAIIILNMVALRCTKLYLPILLQDIYSASPIAAGYVSYLTDIGWTIGSLIGAALNTNFGGRAGPNQPFYKSSRFGLNAAFAVAPLICAFGMTVAWLLIPLPSNSAFVPLAMSAAFLAVGFCSGLFWPHILARIMQSAPPQEKEAADSSIVIVQFFAPALADCVAGAIINAAGYQPGKLASLSYASFILFGFCTLLLIIAWLIALQVKKFRLKSAG